jgi:hypothetical protein
MKNFTEQFKAQIERLTPATLKLTKKESPDYIKGFKNFKSIVLTNSLKNIVEEEKEMKQQREILEIKENLIVSKECFGCQSIRGTKFNIKTFGLNLEEIRELMPFESLVLAKETTENSFSFLYNPSYEDSEVVTLFNTTFTPPYTKLHVSHWEMDVKEITEFLHTNTKDEQNLINT